MIDAGLAKHKMAARQAFAKAAGSPAASVKAKPRIASMPEGPTALALDFERSVPRCESCRHFRPGKIVLKAQTRNMPVLMLPALCKKGNFLTRATAVCRHWLGTDGSVFDQERRAP